MRLPSSGSRPVAYAMIVALRGHALHIALHLPMVHLVSVVVWQKAAVGCIEAAGE